MEHDPNTCGCKYLGCDMWSCGHVDNEPAELETLTPEEWQAGMGCTLHRKLRSGSCHDCAMLQPPPLESLI